MRSVYLLLLLTLIFSCKESKEDKLIRLVTEWQGREIIFTKQVTITSIAYNSQQIKSVFLDRIMIISENTGSFDEIVTFNMNTNQPVKVKI